MVRVSEAPGSASACQLTRSPPVNPPELLISTASRLVAAWSRGSRILAQPSWCRRSSRVIPPSCLAAIRPRPTARCSGWTSSRGMAGRGFTSDPRRRRLALSRASRKGFRHPTPPAQQMGAASCDSSAHDRPGPRGCQPCAFGISLRSQRLRAGERRRGLFRLEALLRPCPATGHPISGSPLTRAADRPAGFQSIGAPPRPASGDR